MEGRALSTDAFADFAKQVVPFYHLTTRVPGDADQKLLQAVGGRGFPTLVVLDNEGKLVVTHRGARSVEAFVDTWRQAHTKKESLRKLAWLTPPEPEGSPMERFLTKVERGDFSMAEAKTKYASVEPSAIKERAAETKRAHAAFAALEIREAFSKARKAPGLKAANDVAEQAMLEMYRGKRMPSADLAWPVWEQVMAWAERTSDAKTLAEALAGWRASRGDDPALQNFYRERAARLKALEAKARK